MLTRGSRHQFPPLTQKAFVVGACWERGGGDTELSATPSGRAHDEEELANRKGTPWFFVYFPHCEPLIFFIFCLIGFLIILIFIYLWGKGVWTWSWMNREDLGGTGGTEKHEWNRLYNFLKNRKWNIKKKYSKILSWAHTCHSSTWSALRQEDPHKFQARRGYRVPPW